MKEFDLRGQNLVPCIVRNLPLNRQIFIEATCYGAEKNYLLLFNLAFFDYPHPEGKGRGKKLEGLKSLGYIK